MIAARPSYIARIFAELVRNSRRTGTQRAAPLNGGAELVVLVRDGMITLTIKRPHVAVGSNEITVFKRDCGVPGGAEVVTPIVPREQRSRPVDGVAWFYVSFRWEDNHA